MKRIVRKYRFSKFKRFTDGLLFAIISVIALTLCLMNISDCTVSSFEIILPFIAAIVSMLIGFTVMFREDTVTKGKI